MSGNWGRILLSLAALAVVVSSTPARGDTGYLDQGSIVAWGQDGPGRVSNPPGGAYFTQISTGGSGFALATDGSIVGWGSDSYSVISGKPTGTGYTQVSAGSGCGLALASDGSIVAWGRDDYGQVSSKPVGTGYTQVAAADTHCLALTSDGSIVAWGNDDFGQVSGRPSGSGHKYVAAAALTLIPNVSGYSLALAADGSITAWGFDTYGLFFSLRPAGNGYVQLAPGRQVALALASDGSIVGWGFDASGFLSLKPPGTGYSQIAAGSVYGLALASDASIVAWGMDDYGQVSASPKQGYFLSISANRYWAAALKARVQYDDLIITGSGTRSLLQRDVAVSGDVSIDSALTVQNNPSLIVGGTTTLSQGFSLPTSGWTLHTGNLALAANTSMDAFSAIQVSGSVVVNPGVALSLTGQGFGGVSWPSTVLIGGTIEAPNGARIDEVLSGHGDVTGAVSASNGSTILADGGDLRLGTASAANGFATFGVLRTGTNRVTLLDSNRAYLGGGSLTCVGSASGQGTLVAANGLDVAQGATISGRGLIDTPNDPFLQLVNNGSIEGDSADNPIYLSGYVKGVGTFNNVIITGTDSPGLSPTQQFVGSKGWSETATLILELGGVIPGAQHDQIVASGELTFGGVLEVILINGFEPSDGDVFDLFSGASRGQFEEVNLPSLRSGLSWDTGKLYTDGTVQVIPEPATLGLLALGALVAVRRRGRWA